MGTCCFFVVRVLNLQDEISLVKEAGMQKATHFKAEPQASAVIRPLKNAVPEQVEFLNFTGRANLYVADSMT